MKYLLILLFIVQASYSQKVDYVQTSQKLIESILSKKGNTDQYIASIAKADETELLNQLSTDDLKKTFFINVYNSFTNYSLTKNPEQYKDRNAFFKSEQFVIAGNKVSLDIIEHDFLRRSSIKLSLGKLHKIFPSKLEKKFRVDTVDYRIHFALNCGAKSCPPVRIYDERKINEQLEAATNSYLKANTTYDTNNNSLEVPSLMSWFRGDFGNKKGVLKICKKFNIIPEKAKPALSYKTYDWTLDLNNFIQ